MKKDRLYQILIFAILCLITYIGYAIIAHSGVGKSPVEVELKQSYINLGDKGIIRYIIHNKERDSNYTYVLLVNNTLNTNWTVYIPKGKMFQGSLNFYPTASGTYNVTFILYRNNETEPFEETTYYITVENASNYSEGCCQH